MYSCFATFAYEIVGSVGLTVPSLCWVLFDVMVVCTHTHTQHKYTVHVYPICGYALLCWGYQHSLTSSIWYFSFCGTRFWYEFLLMRPIASAAGTRLGLSIFFFICLRLLFYWNRNLFLTIIFNVACSKFPFNMSIYLSAICLHL